MSRASFIFLWASDVCVYSCEVAKGVLARVGTSKEEGGSLLRRLQQAPREAMCATTSNLKLCSSVRHNIRAVIFLGASRHRTCHAFVGPNDNMQTHATILDWQLQLLSAGARVLFFSMV